MWLFSMVTKFIYLFYVVVNKILVTISCVFSRIYVWIF